MVAGSLLFMKKLYINIMLVNSDAVLNYLVLKEIFVMLIDLLKQPMKLKKL